MSMATLLSILRQYLFEKKKKTILTFLVLSSMMNSILLLRCKATYESGKI